jgi:succinate dehydrogenase / fumarate reductase cytochrome b subunit
MMYRWHAGYVAWLLNRITGIAITFYLVLHIWVIQHLAQGPEKYGKVMEFLSSKFFTLLEFGLIGAVLYHMMNGIRVVLIDLGRGVHNHKTTFWVLMGIGVILYVLCAWELVGGLFAAAHEAAAPQS